MSMNLQTERLRPLPVRVDDLWQGGVLRIDTPVRDDDGTLVTPAGCLWISRTAGKFHLGNLGPPANVTPAAVVAAMVEFATDPNLAGFRPGRVEVMDAAHAAALTEVVGPLGIAVAVVDQLPAIRAMEKDLSERMAEELPPTTDGVPPPPLEADPAVTPAQMAGLAAAAAEFHRAQPWKHFGPADVLQVVSPKVERALKFVNVMGGGGEQFGLAFFPSKAGFLKLLAAPQPTAYAMRNAMVSFSLDDADGVPGEDVATWKRMKSPTGKRDGRAVYPFPIRFERGDWKRPTAAELATMEGLMRAVTAAKPKELATGKAVTVAVTTAAGPVAYKLRLTTVADPFDTTANDSPGAMTPSEALELVFLSLVRDLSGDPPAAAPAARRAAWEKLRAAVQGSTIAAQRAGAAAAVALDPTMADAHVLAGVTAVNPTGAAAGFRAAVDRSSTEADPNAFVRGLVGLSIAESSLGNTAAALTLMQQIADLIPTSPLAAELMGLGGRA